MPKFVSPQIRTAYTELVSDDGIDFSKSPSLTKQCFADECDINNIVEAFAERGIISHVNEASPRYGDFVGFPDYQSALNSVNAANASFMALPAKIRSDFDNDPAAFVAFCENPENMPALVDMGLAEALPPIASGVTATQTAKSTPDAPAAF
ncbi:MAG: internal scaffolding protein [Microvirus sp.]|nr:MAG: internal scaffolding protein [Microvirus sp.]